MGRGQRVAPDTQLTAEAGSSSAPPSVHASMREHESETATSLGGRDPSAHATVASHLSSISPVSLRAKVVPSASAEATAAQEGQVQAGPSGRSSDTAATAPCDAQWPSQQPGSAAAAAGGNSGGASENVPTNAQRSNGFADVVDDLANLRFMKLWRYQRDAQKQAKGATGGDKESNPIPQTVARAYSNDI